MSGVQSLKSRRSKQVLGCQREPPFALEHLKRKVFSGFIDVLIPLLRGESFSHTKITKFNEPLLSY